MARKPVAPPPFGGGESSRSQVGEAPVQSGRAEDRERYGILALARLRKDDGRSLILYSYDEDGAGGEADSAPDGEHGQV